MMLSLTPPRLAAIALSAALLLGLCERTQAQVVIHDTVDLSRSPDGTSSGPSAQGGFVVSFVAQEDGVLQLQYGTIERAGTPYPSGQPTLEIYRDGVLMATDDVLSHGWPPPTVQTTYSCGGNTYTRTLYNATLDVFIDAVQEGETISFLFKTDYDTYGDDPGEGGATPGGGAVAIGKFSGPCVIELFEFIADIVEPTFIRQDNTTVTDSVLTVSRMRADVDLNSTATFEGPVPPAPDPHTYRIEVEGFAAGLDTLVTFEVEVTDPVTGLPETYTYGSVEGIKILANGDTVAVYRMDQHVRLVSNGIPTVGADPEGQYDDEYNDGGGGLEDQTLLVRLGYQVRGVAEDTSGTVLFTDDFTVGREGCTDASDTICAVYVQFHNYAELTDVNEAVSVEKASEDWAQGTVQFELSGPGESIVPVKNVLQVEGAPTERGTVLLRVIASSDTVGVKVRIAETDDTETVAQKIAEAISDSTGLPTQPVKHHSNPDEPVYPWWVLVNRGHEVTFQIVTAPSGVTLSGPSLNFYPVPLDSLHVNEFHALALNFSDADSLNVDVYAVPDSSLFGVLGTIALTIDYVWRDFMPGAENSVFVEERSVDAADSTRPFTFGHELGHILIGPLHATDSLNLMFSGCLSSGCGTSAVESWDATKRLRQGQIDTVRTRSGPGSSTNPLLRNPPALAPFALSQPDREDRRGREGATGLRSRTVYRSDRSYRERK